MMGKFRKGIVYKYTSPSGKSYIGQTINESRRTRQHLHNAKIGLNFPLYSAFNKYGIDNFKYEIVFSFESNDDLELKEQLDKMEMYYIGYYDTYNNGYNCSLGGEGQIGYKHSDITKNKIREKKTGTKWGFHTEETKMKMSISAKGKSKSIEHKLKIKEATKGKIPDRTGSTHSIESKMKMSISQKLLWKNKKEKLCQDLA